MENLALWPRAYRHTHMGGIYLEYVFIREGLFMLMKMCLSLCVAISVLLITSGAAFAFDQNAVKSAREQIEQKSKAAGGTFRSLVIRPQLTLSQLYDNNIFRESDDAKTDLITTIKPKVDIRTNWALHQIGFAAEADLGRYREHASENYNDHSYKVFARYDLDYETYLSLNLGRVYRHEDRGAVDDVDGEEPIKLRVDTANIAFTRELGLLKLYMTGIARKIAYDDSVRAGVVIDNSIRDRQQYIGRLRLAYSVSDNADVFLQGQYEERKYDQFSASFRDSKGNDIRGGMSLNLSGKLEASAYLGYVQQDFKSGFSDISGVNWGGNLLWDMNGLTSLELDLERMVLETALEGTSGVLRTRGSAELQHMFSPHIMLAVHTGLMDDQYQGGTSSRNNQIFKTGANVQYDMNQNWELIFDYDYLYRDFKEASGDYDNHNVALAVKYAY